jgi:hypothetical protein
VVQYRVGEAQPQTQQGFFAMLLVSIGTLIKSEPGSNISLLILGIVFFVGLLFAGVSLYHIVSKGFGVTRTIGGTNVGNTTITTDGTNTNIGVDPSTGQSCIQKPCTMGQCVPINSPVPTPVVNPTPSPIPVPVTPSMDLIKKLIALEIANAQKPCPTASSCESPCGDNTTPTTNASTTFTSAVSQ